MKMLGFDTVLLHPPIPPPLKQSISMHLRNPLLLLLSPPTILFPSIVKIPVKRSVQRRRKLFLLCAENGGGRGGKDEEEEEEEEERRNGRRRLTLRLGDLLNPDPENIVAVGLTGLVTWASVQVLWQLCFVSVAILVAALKYSFVAALLLFILIALL